MSASIGSKPTEWESVVASDPSCLITSSSAKVVHKVLSTAGGRAPQKILCAVVEGHLPKMLSDENGTAILSSLVRFGTRQTVAKIVPSIMKLIDPKKMTEGVAHLFRFITQRSGCSEEADKLVANNVAVIVSDFSLPNAMYAIPCIVAQDPKVLEKVQLRKVFKAETKSLRAFFLKSVLDSSSEKGVVGAALWKLVKSSSIDDEAAAILASSDLTVADLVTAFLLKESDVSKWSVAGAACIRAASLDNASALCDAFLRDGRENPAIIGAIQSRFPDRAFGNPKLAAVATQWTRAHLNVIDRTRETVNARIAQKRSREDEEESF